VIIILSENKQEYDSDVIVVGAGPAGSAAAHYLVCAGYNVILIDKCKFPRDKVCGDFVSPVAQNELERIGITGTVEFKKSNQIRRASVYLSKPSTDLPFSRLGKFGIWANKPFFGF
jgi:flavin-dependent dehydrogenase